MPDRLATRTIITFFSFILLSTPALLYGLSDSIAAPGGHYNRKTGEYHNYYNNIRTTVELTSRQESGGKTTTRNTKMFLVDDGSITIRKEKAKIHPRYKIIRGQVVGITDGNSINVFNFGKETRVRLYGVETPEKEQEYWLFAKRFTSEMVAGKLVDIESIDTDLNGRTVGLVKVNGVSLNEALVRAGYAWVYDKDCREDFCSDWKRLEKTARDNRVGLWASLNPQAPWNWRKEKKRKKVLNGG